MFKKQILYEYFKLSSNIICLNMIPNYTLNTDNFFYNILFHNHYNIHTERGNYINKYLKQLV